MTFRDFFVRQQECYLDNSASTKVDPEVIKAMKPYFDKKYGNPSSRHEFGRHAHEAIEKARERIAKAIGADPAEIVFTSGGTESDNLAIRGMAHAVSEIISSNIEHDAILKTCADVSALYRIPYTQARVDGRGLLPEQSVSEIRENTLVSIMLANNEIGTIQPIKEICEAARDSAKRCGATVYLHTDAVQAVGKMKVDVRELGVDMLSLSSHKFHGPKGVGVLFIREGVKPKSIQTGGGHEGGLRAGTENVPGIVGMGKAAEIATRNLAEDAERMRVLRNLLADGVLERLERAEINGDREKRLPNNVNFRFFGVDGDKVLDELNEKGIGASTGSACSSKKSETSHVLRALGDPDGGWHSWGALRLTLSRFTTKREIRIAIDEVPDTVSALRRESPAWRNRQKIR